MAKPAKYIRLTRNYILPKLAQLTEIELKLILCLLRYRDNRTGLCCPSYESIQADTGMSRLSISTAIKKLVGKGMIEVKHRSIVGEGRINNAYRILDGTYTYTDVPLTSKPG